MRGNGASFDEPDECYDNEMNGDFELLDELADETVQRQTARQRAQRRAYRPNYSKPGRRPASEREGAFNALMWMIDGATGLLEELRHNDLGLPEEFWVHAYAARRESLLALRAILDAWIDEEPPLPPSGETQERPKRRGGINIDF